MNASENIRVSQMTGRETEMISSMPANSDEFDEFGTGNVGQRTVIDATPPNLN